MMLEDSIYRYWGKADPKYPGEPKWHPAILHMLDVAAVARALLNVAGPRRNLLFRALPAVDVAHPLEWLSLLVALHDLGKLTPGFQAKVPELAQPLLVQGLPFQTTLDGGDHKLNGFSLLADLFRDLGVCEAAAVLAQFPAAHHGRFLLNANWKKERIRCGGTPWLQPRAQVIEALSELFGVGWEEFPWRDSEALPTPPMIVLAGLIAVADWIGSDADSSRFPYCDPAGLRLGDYWVDRLARARRVIATLHLHQQPAAPGVSQFGGLFPFDTPNPCQGSVLEMMRSITGAALLIVETPMGSGKTEAALAAADIVLRERGALGLYYALPTQATANQMFGRMEAFLRRNPGVDQGELHLIHAYAALQPAYEELRATSVDGGEGDLTASDWFAGRKRGLLSPFAVGTVDQALMAALRSKHHFVRLFALAGKVVVIDEVHAYDTYTSTLLENLLRWLAQLCCTVILLSATLPPSKRQALVGAWRKDASFDAPPRYPCVIGLGTTGNAQVREVYGIPQQPYRLEPLRVAKERRWEAISELVTARIEPGGCAACILNTVGEAQALFNRLRHDPALADAVLVLFHARFPLRQRLDIERLLETHFGKPENAGDHRPHRAVVVATQVLEQSLDVDFDLMVSDIAPIDLLLQRAGRLHRHDRPRPPGLEDATLFVLQPDLHVARPDLKPSDYIYAPELLLKTALLLEPGPIRIEEPQDLERLICKIYEEAVADCPEHLRTLLEDQAFQSRWEGKRLDQEAQKAQLPPEWDAETFFEAMNHAQTQFDDDAADTEALTRLARPRVTLVVLHDLEGRPSLSPDRAEPVRLTGEERIPLDEARALLLHSVSISDADWVKFFQAQSAPPPWQRTALLRNCRVAVFCGGEFVREGRRLRISSALGMEIVHPEKKK